jgi:predicted DNA-binding transcriptional regulator AlpA
MGVVETLQTVADEIRELRKLLGLADELRKIRDLLANTPRLTAKDVMRRYGWSRSTLYRKQKRGFPKPQRGFWAVSDLDAWDAQPGQTQAGQSVQRPSSK